MEPNSAGYAKRAAESIRDQPGVREAVTDAALVFDAKRRAAYDAIDADGWRDWAAAVKSHLLTHLDVYLEQAEEQLQANGATVHWALDREEALQILDDLVERYGVRRIVKGKSMLTEELGINEHLGAMGVDVVESDLGEYIIQLLEEPPSHIIAPALHLSLEDVQRLFNDRFGTALDATPETLCQVARERLRNVFIEADMGITGGNFLVAETGTLVLIENEGNIRMSTSVPKVHVAFVGIEKLLPEWDDIATFVQLTARAGTGQGIGIYVSMLDGPSGPDEPDGPDALHVVLVDNGRTRVLADPVVWEALRCIRCGACLNACPVYRQTGGHAYGWVYSGPIGAVLAPAMLDTDDGLQLPFASTLCGACVDACPVRIPIPDLLLTWRERAVAAGKTGMMDRTAFRTFAEVATRPALYHGAGRVLTASRGSITRHLPMLRDWAPERGPLVPSPRTFQRSWPDLMDLGPDDEAP